MTVLACGRPAVEEPAVGPKEGDHHPTVGQLAPDFMAEVPTGGWLPLRNLKEKPIALLLYRPEAPFVRELVAALGRFRADRSMAPTLFFGVAQGSLDDLKRFDQLTQSALPTLRDPGSIAASYGVGEAPAVILLDARHVVRYRLDGFAGRHFGARIEALAAALRKLPAQGDGASPDVRMTYTEHPRAPLFTARDLDGHAVDLAAQRGHVVVLLFFDQECPHCQLDLPRLVPVLRDFRRRDVRAIGISSRNVAGGMRAFLKKEGIDFPVVIDLDRAIFTQFGSTRTPDLFIVDPGGFIRFRETGDREDRSELMSLELRIALGSETPAAIAASLPKGRYLGAAQCAACHESQLQDWYGTPHSIAWDSLSQNDKWKDKECVPCHVTGLGKPGGFVDLATTPQMTNVQCEVCHGMGGGHPEGRAADPQTLAAVCTTCHTGKFVLNFSIDEALPLVAHREHADRDRLFQYSDLKKQRIEEINMRRLEKFKTGVAHVGADACRDCHRKEYDQWSRTPHAAAFARLLQAGRGVDPTCVPCHTTGFGMRRGFGDPLAQASMAGVQCEVCHGPGEDHVKAPPALKKETIYGITDQCSFCIIQGVCATCHDRANDPGFNIETALPKVKH